MLECVRRLLNVMRKMVEVSSCSPARVAGGQRGIGGDIWQFFLRQLATLKVSYYSRKKSPSVPVWFGIIFLIFFVLFPEKSYYNDSRDYMSI